jgi:hypothetical protein
MALLGYSFGFLVLLGIVAWTCSPPDAVPGDRALRVHRGGVVDRRGAGQNDAAPTTAAPIMRRAAQEKGKGEGRWIWRESVSAAKDAP